MSFPRPSRLKSPPLVRGMAVLALLWGSGCANRMGLVRSQSPNRNAVRLVAGPKRPVDTPINASSAGEGHMGPVERALKSSEWDRKKADAVASGDAFSIDGLHEYQAAEALYLEGRLPEAEKAFQKLAKKRRSNHETFGQKVERWWGIAPATSLDSYSNFGDPIEEDALFMKAECQFDQKRFARAQDSYDNLLTKYPSTRHLDAVSRRYFQIARYWLGFPEKVEETGDVVTASDSSEETADFENVDSFYIPIIPNFTDKTRPGFDTRGRALAALRSVWLHDATGPLADDALMVSASFSLRTKDYEESARLYKLLRDQYPESPHFRDAFLLGSHVTLASYQGSNYDGQNLKEAIDLKESALRIFPDLTEDERNRLGSELGKMHDAEVARIWDRVEYFRAKNSPESVALYCNILINQFPDTIYAEQSRQILEQQAATQARKQTWSMPQLLRKKPDQGDQAQPDSKESVEPPPEEPAPEKVPLKFPRLKWPFRAVPKPEQPPETNTPNQESDSADTPRYQEASAKGQSNSGRATLE